MKKKNNSNSADDKPLTTGPLQDEVLRLKVSERELTAALEHERSQRAALAERYSGLEAQYRSLARLYVAAHRLLSAESQGDICAAVEDVVANLIGCEEVGIFRLEDDTSEVRLISSIGLDTGELARIPVQSSLIGATLLRGEAHFGGKSECRLAQEANITACIPLRSKDRLFGAIATFRLLPQKPELSAEDRELLSLLGRLSAVLLSNISIPGTSIQES